MATRILPVPFRPAAAPDLPFLYPPFVLPLIAPLTFLPRSGRLHRLVRSCSIGAAYASARRLGFGLVTAGGGPALAAVPRGARSGGNIQILLFLAYVVLMHRDGRQLDPADRERPAFVDGILGAFVGALKVSQVHAWVYVLRRRPAAALIGLMPFVIVALVTLPVVGLDLWFDWLSQASRSGDPSWPYIGAPLSIFVGLPDRPCPVGPVRAGGLRGATASRERVDRHPCPGRVAVAPHVFGALPAPGMILIRREIALVAAILVSTYAGSLIWIAVVLVAWSLIAMDRWPDVLARSALPNPRRRPDLGLPRVALSYPRNPRGPGATLHRPCVSPSSYTGLPLPSVWS